MGRRRGEVRGEEEVEEGEMAGDEGRGGADEVDAKCA